MLILTYIDEQKGIYQMMVHLAIEAWWPAQYIGHSKLYFHFWFPARMLLAVSRFSASSLVVYCMHEMTCKYLVTKICISRESDWFVLVAVMLMYCSSAWSLEKSRTRNKSTTWSSLTWDTLCLMCLTTATVSTTTIIYWYHTFTPQKHSVWRWVSHMIKYHLFFLCLNWSSTISG